MKRSQIIPLSASLALALSLGLNPALAQPQDSSGAGQRGIQRDTARTGQTQTGQTQTGQTQDRYGTQDRFGTQDRYQTQQQRQQQQRFGGAGQQQDESGAIGVVLDQTTTGEGVRVRGVYQDSPAERADIRVGDRIVSVDGSRINDVNDLVRRISGKEPDQRVELTVIGTDGQRERVNVRLGSRQEELEGRLTQESQQQRQQTGQWGTGQQQWGTGQWGTGRDTTFDRDQFARTGTDDSIRQALTEIRSELRQLRQRVEQMGQETYPTSRTDRRQQTDFDSYGRQDDSGAMRSTTRPGEQQDQTSRRRFDYDDAQDNDSDRWNRGSSQNQFDSDDN